MHPWQLNEPGFLPLSIVWLSFQASGRTGGERNRIAKREERQRLRQRPPPSPSLPSILPPHLIHPHPLSLTLPTLWISHTTRKEISKSTEKPWGGFRKQNVHPPPWGNMLVLDDASSWQDWRAVLQDNPGRWVRSRLTRDNSECTSYLLRLLINPHRHSTFPGGNSFPFPWLQLAISG